MNKKIKNIVKNRRSIVVCILVIGVLYSCVPTKTLKEENVDLPDTYQTQSTDTTNTATVKWRDFFSDPYLIALIDTALVNNQELNIMLQQIDVAQSEVKTRTGEYLPFINYGAGAEVEKVGEYTRDGAVEKNLDIKDGEEFPEPLTDYSVGLSASWELDIWKKLRNSKKAARSRILVYHRR